ncbi:hypothetical protein BC835DRAFT_25073 [Cytidiella melzeri]|nr:hypothetical protein BC835DRAFT_25073 [Cytidiella melzeri]
MPTQAVQCWMVASLNLWASQNQSHAVYDHDRPRRLRNVSSVTTLRKYRCWRTSFSSALRTPLHLQANTGCSSCLFFNTLSIVYTYARTKQSISYLCVPSRASSLSMHSHIAVALALLAIVGPTVSGHIASPAVCSHNAPADPSTVVASGNNVDNSGTTQLGMPLPAY